MIIITIIAVTTIIAAPNYRTRVLSRHCAKRSPHTLSSAPRKPAKKVFFSSYQAEEETEVQRTSAHHSPQSHGPGTAERGQHSGLPNLEPQASSPYHEPGPQAHFRTTTSPLHLLLSPQPKSKVQPKTETKHATCFRRELQPGLLTEQGMGLGGLFASDCLWLASDVHQPPLAWQSQSQNYVCPHEMGDILIFLSFFLSAAIDLSTS